ncbi:hypothetical protein BH11ACT8_BH11ACT8_07410 [soil metagenome]
MTLHKLTAGSGYEYLTRQVAALDATDKGHTGLADYYEAKGESPGQWTGSGMAGITGLDAGDAVTAEQMFNLFGLGLHPLADDLEAQHDAWIDAEERRGDARERMRSGWLGKPYAVHTNDVTPLQIEVAQRVTNAQKAGGGGPVPAQVRARIRTQVALKFFTADYGRGPKTERELAGYVAKQTRPRTTAVAGYDLTFSPVKSVSALWAIADPHTAKMIEHAHSYAVADALAFIEDHALYTRTGAGGIRQIKTTGLVAAAFTHRDSRAGDPDLHTHVAVANKVQALNTDQHGHLTPGRWLAIDGRVLFKANVAASETYNTRLEHHLTKALGVRFADRVSPVGGHLRGTKRPVREIVGIDPALLTRWSTRRRQVVDAQTDLATRFRADHGRPPTPVEALHLAQQANLQTRQAKHHGRSEANQRRTWRTEAVEVLGGDPNRLGAMVDRALTPPPAKTTPPVDARWVQTTAARVISELEQRRATWQTWHVRPEAERQIRAASMTVKDPDALVLQVVDAAMSTHSVSLAGPADTDFEITPHPALRRPDGASAYTVHGSQRFTSTRILAAEHRLLAHAAETGAPVVPEHHGRLAMLEAAANGTPLNRGQAALVQDMATSGRRVQLAIAAAGTGKTTALRALASAWTDAGGNVVALAPSAAAAGALTEALGTVNDGRDVHVETLAKLTHTLNTRPNQPPDWVAGVGASTLLIIDEAGMADTLTLDQVVHHAATHGATTRLVGDDQQLAAIGAGGLLRDIKKRHGAVHLDELMRFTNPTEADATLLLRDGDPAALDFYLDHDRIHVGDQYSILNDVLHAWHHDRTNGLDGLMLAPTRDQVRDLNQQAQRLLHPDTAGLRTALADGLSAGIGDLVITRTNDRRLRLSATDWVTNGDRWHITGIGRDGSLDVTHATNGLHARLPQPYVAASVELGYATTVHTAQGTTADTVHGLVTGSETRQDLYTMLTRGRQENHAYLPAGVTTGDVHELIRPDAIHPSTARETLEKVLNNDGASTSAATELETAHDPMTLLQHARDRYDDALNLACESVVGAATIDAVEDHAEQLVPSLTEQPAWPTLRQRLVHAAADNHDPIDLLDHAAERGRLHDTHDPAATLTWRLHTLANTDEPSNELPSRVQQNPAWSTYLQQRQAAVDEARHNAMNLSDDELSSDDAAPVTGARRPQHDLPLMQPPRLGQPPAR